MRIHIVLAWTDPADVDENDPTGMTAEAYERMTDAINTAGYNIVSVEKEDA